MDERLGSVDGISVKNNCPKCEQSRAKGARYCLFCHAELFRQSTELEYKDRSAIRMTAEKAMERLKVLPLAQILVSDQLPDGTLPNLKRLVVQPGTYTVMVSQFQGTTVLKPGQYECSRLGIGSGIKNAFQAGYEPRPVFFCTVSQTPVTATFVLPDFELLFDETGTEQTYDVNTAVSRLGIRTSDNYLGGAQAQLVLRCVAPARLLEMFIQARLQSLDAEEKVKLGLPVNAKDRAELSRAAQDPGPERATAATPGGAKGIFAYSLAVVARVLWGGGTQMRSAEPVALSVWDVYRAVRMEFAAAIGQSVRNEPIAHLFDAVEVRDRIADDIQKIMSQSFDMYGIKIERVSAFRFICPKYEDVLERRANIARDGEQLDDRRKESEIAAKQREVDLGDHIDISRTATELQKRETSDKAGLERHGIREDRETERDRDALRAEKQVRQLAMDAAAHQHQLGKELATERQRMELDAEQERQRLELQTEKMNAAIAWQERWMELQDKQQDAMLERQTRQQHALIDRRIKMLEQYAKLPKDSVLTIALAENPQLAAAYAASVQAQTQQEKAQMQEKFRSELATAYAGNNAQFTVLLQEAVRQWGHYQVAKQIGHQHPQQVINVAVPTPTDEPAPEQGEPTGGNSQ